jgi:hypothetical protein
MGKELAAANIPTWPGVSLSSSTAVGGSAYCVIYEPDCEIVLSTPEQQKALVPPKAGASIMVVLAKRCGGRLVGFGCILLRKGLFFDWPQQHRL